MSSQYPTVDFRTLLTPRSLSIEILSTPGLELIHSGRGAILQACLEIAQGGKTEILMPAYHCPSAVTPALAAGLTPIFYHIGRDLSLDYEDLIAKVSPATAAVLVIHFFGRSVDLRPLHRLRDAGIALIEDWSHSFLLTTPLRLSGEPENFRIYSFWKLVPTQIGGGL